MSRRLHLTLIALGSRGDVQPLVALGDGLRRVGFGVRVAALPPFRPLIEEHGLEFAPLQGDLQGLLRNAARGGLMESGRNFFASLRQFRHLLADTYLDLFRSIWEATQGTDAIGFGTVTIMAYPVADKRGVPRFVLPLQPITHSRAYPSLTFPQAIGRLGGAVNLLTHHLNEQAYWATVRPLVNRALREVLDWPPYPRSGPYRAVYADRTMPFVYGVSPLVFPRPQDWPAWHVLTGFWYLTTQRSAPLPDEVEAFLADGPPPVYIGFGSMVTRDPRGRAEAVLEALRRVGMRAILARGWGGLAPTDLPPHTLLVEEVPHLRLFPRVAAVVHHGGAGTTAAALWAGVPQVVVPHFADQPFWAERMARLGVAPPPIPARRLTAQRLTDALRAVQRPALRQRAADLGHRLREEDGVARAVAYLTRFLEQSRS